MVTPWGRAYSYGINVWRAGPCVIVMWIYKCSRLLLVLHDVISRDIYTVYGSLTCVFTTIAHNTQRNLVMCRAGTSDLFVATINRFDVTVTECSWTLRPQTAVLCLGREAVSVTPVCGRAPASDAFLGGRAETFYVFVGRFTSGNYWQIRPSANSHETWLFLNIATHTAFQDASDDCRWQLKCDYGLWPRWGIWRIFRWPRWEI